MTTELLTSSLQYIVSNKSALVGTAGWTMIDGFIKGVRGGQDDSNFVDSATYAWAKRWETESDQSYRINNRDTAECLTELHDALESDLSEMANRI